MGCCLAPLSAAVLAVAYPNCSVGFAAVEGLHFELAGRMVAPLQVDLQRSLVVPIGSSLQLYLHSKSFPCWDQHQWSTPGEGSYQPSHQTKHPVAPPLLLLDSNLFALAGLVVESFAVVDWVVERSELQERHRFAEARHSRHLASQLLLLLWLASRLLVRLHFLQRTSRFAWHIPY